ncbi:hypothetical protein D3C81_1242210 [compost metagenome]
MTADHSALPYEHDRLDSAVVYRIVNPAHVDDISNVHEYRDLFKMPGDRFEIQPFLLG